MEVQERILDTAFNLFRQYGTRSITMDDIAIKMGISKKTLYAHFADKSDLVVNVISRHLKLMQDQCIESRNNSKDAVEELFLVMKMLDEKLRNMNPVVMMDLQKFHAKAFQLFEEHKNVFLMQTIRENLERGIREGLYRPDIDIDILSHFRTASAMFCFQPELFPMNGYDMSKVQRVLLEHFLFGVASVKGYQEIEKYKVKDYPNKY
ncbi:TetR/AcrR family transcriptional regulator [Chitinophaga sp. GCM10012297]|uniref:TetR/AcrR family transcriptional regulator n=1 Tax=Chitinophaga chungangae TaxID=2821488 RepID=A0ABS3YFC2_9BACT|nr:TetR/AcrR family transcriptional regulator [Chitinophaga chungangae]MBO9153373.1 TetR/AcrR family transcriptional regulator [Chitinophaga chungangae]